MQHSIFEIEGTVRSSKKGEITILSATSGKDYTLSCESFCPARTGDKIMGYCTSTPIGWKFIHAPVVQVPVGREAVKTAFIMGTSREKRINSRVAEKLYNYFHEQTVQYIVNTQDRNDPVYRNREMIENAVVEYISLVSNKYIECRDTVSLPELTPEQTGCLMRWWFKSHNLRRLYFLGLTKKEINKTCSRHEISPAELYYLQPPMLPPPEPPPLRRSTTAASRAGAIPS